MEPSTIAMDKKSKTDRQSKPELQVKNARSRYGDGAYEVKIVGSSDSDKSTVVFTSPRALAFNR